jgi:hypothetical protein
LAEVTVTVADAVSPEYAAVTVALPGASAVRRPVVLTLATFGALTVQVTPLQSVLGRLPGASNVASNCCRTVAGIEVVGGKIWSTDPAATAPRLSPTCSLSPGSTEWLHAGRRSAPRRAPMTTQKRAHHPFRFFISPPSSKGVAYPAHPIALKCARERRPGADWRCIQRSRSALP